MRERDPAGEIEGRQRAGTRSTGPRAGGLSLALALALLVLALPTRAGVWVFTDKAGRVHYSDAPRHPGYRRVIDPATRAREASRVEFVQRSGVAMRAWDGVIARAGRTYGVSPGLVKAVVHVESRFDLTAVSHRGAQGLMQLMPATSRSLGVDDPFDPWQNIEGGTRYLRYLMKRFKGDLSLALAAYNAGETAVRRFGGIPPYGETQRYVKRVLALYRRYDADFR